MFELLKRQPFFYLYCLFVTPSYVLPLMGSNSFFANIFSENANNLFLVHLSTLMLAVVVTFFRGLLLKKPWIASIPLAALAFDLTPVLNLVPFVPSALHIATLMAATNTSIRLNPHDLR